MAEPGDKYVVEVEDLLVRPGTYFNPQTEVIVVVDDSASIDQEIFNLEPYEGADWVRISDDVPIDEDARDHALEDFQTLNHTGAVGSISAALQQGDDEELGDAGPDEIEPDPELED